MPESQGCVVTFRGKTWLPGFSEWVLLHIQPWHDSNTNMQLEKCWVKDQWTLFACNKYREKKINLESVRWHLYQDIKYVSDSVINWMAWLSFCYRAAQNMNSCILVVEFLREEQCIDPWDGIFKPPMNAGIGFKTLFLRLGNGWLQKRSLVFIRSTN